MKATMARYRYLDYNTFIDQIEKVISGSKYC